MQVPLVLVNLHAAWERQVRAFRPAIGRAGPDRPVLCGPGMAPTLASSRAYRRLSEDLPVYAAPDQDVCGVDNVSEQRSRSSCLVLKTATTRGLAQDLRRRHC